MRCSKLVASWPVGRTIDAALVAVDQDRVAFVDDVADVVRRGRPPARPSRGRRSSCARSASLPRAPRPSAAAGHIRAVRPGPRLRAIRIVSLVAARSAPRCPSGPKRSAAAGSTDPRGRASAPASSGSSISRMRGAGALLDALDRRLGGQAAVDRLVDPPRPAFVIGEHVVGLEDLLMLAGGAELGLAGHRRRSARASCGRRHRPARARPRCRRRRYARRSRAAGGTPPTRAPCRRPASSPASRTGPAPRLTPAALRPVDQPGVGDQLGQHHRDRLQRLDLDLVVARAARHAGRRARRSRFRGGRSARRRSCGSAPRRFRGDRRRRDGWRPRRG